MSLLWLIWIIRHCYCRLNPLYCANRVQSDSSTHIPHLWRVPNTVLFVNSQIHSFIHSCMFSYMISYFVLIRHMYKPLKWKFRDYAVEQNPQDWKNERLTGVFCLFSFSVRSNSNLTRVSCPGHQDRWTSPMTTHSRTPCLHQGTLTPPKSEYIPADNRCPGFHNRSFQSVVLPKDPVPRELHDPRCLYFPEVFVMVWVHVWRFVHHHLMCFLELNVNGLPYSKNNVIGQRKPLTGAAPHLLKGRG